MPYISAVQISRDQGFLDLVSTVIQEKAVGVSPEDPDAWYAGQVLRSGYSPLDYARAILVDPAVAAMVDMEAGSPAFGIDEPTMKAAVDKVWAANEGLLQVSTPDQQRVMEQQSRAAQRATQEAIKAAVQREVTKVRNVDAREASPSNPSPPPPGVE